MKFKPATLAVFAIVLAGFLFWWLWPGSTDNAHEQGDKLNSREIAALHTGDIILRRGEGLVSNTIAKVLNEPYDVTHSGILMSYQDGWVVVHALSDDSRDINGIIAQPLEQFLAESRKGSTIIVRYCDMHQAKQDIRTTVLRYMDKNLPFDKGFDIYDDSAFYCSELIQHVFMDCFSKDIFPQRISLPQTDLLKYTFLFNEQHFQPIVNHQAVKGI